jgi:hypothetical protein
MLSTTGFVSLMTMTFVSSMYWTVPTSGVTMPSRVFSNVKLTSPFANWVLARLFSMYDDSMNGT